VNKITRNSILVAGVGLLLSACANYDIPSIQGIKAGNNFANGLKLEYITLAETEIEEVDWANAGLFLNKAEAAAGGADVPPEVLADHYRIPDHAISDLDAARFWLMSALKDGAAEKIPYTAAHAQAMFDCWVEEQEEDHQPEDIAKCRADFEAAMAQVDAALFPPKPMAKPMVKPMVKKAMAPKPKSKPMVIPGPFVVYFDFDSAKLTAENAKVVTRAVRAAQTSGVESLILRSHADRAGHNRYNAILSRKRAIAVSAALQSWGIEPSRVKIVAVGEEEPAVATEDGARESLNRRTVITLK